MNSVGLVIRMRRYREAVRALDVAKRLWDEACSTCKALAVDASTARYRVPAELRRAELHNEMRACERRRDIAACAVADDLFSSLGLDVSDCSEDVDLSKVLAASLRVSQL